MRKSILSLIALTATLSAGAQQKISDGTAAVNAIPNSNAILDLESSNKGLLMPRLSLMTTTSAAPLASHVPGMTVYNTNTAGTGNTGVTPGFYYNDGLQWVRLAGSTTVTDDQQLSLNGNVLTLEDGGTVDLSAFLDNTDNQQLSLNNNNLTLQNGGTVTLNPYLDNTDNQQLSLNNNILTLQNGGTVNLAPYLDNTDDQQITTFTLDAATNILTLTLEDGGTKTVDLSNLKAEPWQVQGGTSKATLNTEHIYQMGNVAIQKTTATPNVALDINGAVRGGTNHGTTIGANSVAFGNTNTASGANSTAFGLRNTASGPQSATFGTDNTASGTRATAFGTLNTANGDYATVFGAANTVGGFHSAVFGANNITNAQFEFVIGVGNAVTTGNNTIFQIGNGNPNVVSNRSNALTVLKSGYTGLGNAAIAPTERLDVSEGNLRIRDINTATGTNSDNVVVANPSGVLKTIAASSLAVEPWMVELTTDKATGNTQNIYQMGNVGIGTNDITDGNALDVRGSIRLGGGHSGTVGFLSTAMGYQNISSGGNATTMGRGNRATADYTLAAGYNTLADGYTATALGLSTTATGQASLAIGSGSKAIGNYSFASGFQAEANGGTSTAFGGETKANSRYEMAVGYNNALLSGNATAWVTTDPLFQIGNGEISTIPTNALSILKNGKAAIGTHNTAPAVALEVNGTDAIKVPSGSDAQRPATAQFGQLRYNTTLGRGEMYVADEDGNGVQNDAGWRPL